jgi:integrase
MAGRVKHANLDSRTGRKGLKRSSWEGGTKVHWQALSDLPGRVHLGYECWKGERTGVWKMRRHVGPRRNVPGAKSPYRHETLGRADDVIDANGQDVLSHAQAIAAIRAKVASPQDDAKKPDPATYTVWQAWEDYAKYLEATGKEADDSRARCHIKPTLGDLVVAKLTATKLRDWLANVANTPAQIRSKAGKPQYKAKPETEDEIRARRASANRVLTMLKAALNHAYDESHVPSRDAWGRKLKPFEGVETARVRYLTLAEAKRLLNACDVDFRPLVRAGLETGARYSELARLGVKDFNPDAGTLAIHKSKSSKPRHIKLSPKAFKFFASHCAGRSGLMFTQADGTAWEKNDQSRPMREAVANGKIALPCGFHTTRHTYASHAVMNGMPLVLVAKNLGHKDTRMVEKHYGHLAPDWAADIIMKTAPDYEVPADKTVVPLR